MNAHDVIRNSLESARQIAQGYLEDLTEAELLVRPTPEANHIAWQLGHLIEAEHDLVNAACPGAMPALPDGFKEKYTPETAKLDDPNAFHSKAEYLKLWSDQRAATLAALDSLSDADLDKPSPVQFAKTIGALFNMQGLHPLMHVGQWAVVRRKLGRKPLF
ncbi:MAG TPA: DinB family protein [Pirellulales bacterium]|nr:DinB family protein [Pirellulales bacterium]